MSRKRIFDRVFDKSNLIPPRKKVKRESSKALDDSAERAAEERLMLLGATRHDKDFQPRYFLTLQGLIVGSRFSRTGRSGGRNKWKRKRIRPRRFLARRSLVMCLIILRRWMRRSVSSRNLLQRWSQYRPSIVRVRLRHSLHPWLNLVSRKLQTGSSLGRHPLKSLNSSPCNRHNSRQPRSHRVLQPDEPRSPDPGLMNSLSHSVFSKPPQRYPDNYNPPEQLPQTPLRPSHRLHKFPSNDYPRHRAMSPALPTHQEPHNLSPPKNRPRKQTVKS